MHRTILIPVFAILLGPASAQTLPQAITDVNAAFGGTVQVKQDRRQQLVFDLFDASGRFRQDIVLPNELDTAAIHFSAEEDAIIVGCRADKPQCISKEIFKMNTIRATSRVNLPRPAADPEGKATMATLKAMIAAAAEQLVATETRERSQRMK